jgi:hypothetical protein
MLFCDGTLSEDRGLTMVLSENDWNVLYRDSIRRVADLLDIVHSNTTPETLLDAIRNQDPETFARLNSFLSAWKRWYEFHRTIEAAGAAGRLTPEQHQELVALVRDRDTTRAALVRTTKQLELRRITIRVPPDHARPGRELEVAARIRRDLYAHGPIELDPDDPRFSTRRVPTKRPGHHGRRSRAAQVDGPSD